MPRFYRMPGTRTHISALRTENIWTCISLAGVNDQGVGFLCHFDRPCTVDGLPKVIKALEGVTDDFDTFKLKTIAAGSLGPTYNCWTHRKLRKALEQMGGFNTPMPETTVVSPGVYNWRMKCGLVVNTESREITITPPHIPFIDYTATRSSRSRTSGTTISMASATASWSERACGRATTRTDAGGKRGRVGV
jgi:hypothetical protein